MIQDTIWDGHQKGQLLIGRVSAVIMLSTIDQALQNKLIGKCKIVTC